MGCAPIRHTVVPHLKGNAFISNGYGRQPHWLRIALTGQASPIEGFL